VDRSGCSRVHCIRWATPEHHGLLAWILRVPQRRRSTRLRECSVQAPARADRRRHRLPSPRPSHAIRIGNPASWYGATAAASESAEDLRGDRRGDPGGLPVPRHRGVGLLRGSLGGVCRGLLRTPVPKGTTVVCVLTATAEGPGSGDQPSVVPPWSTPTLLVLGALGSDCATRSVPRERACWELILASMQCPRSSLRMPARLGGRPEWGAESQSLSRCCLHRRFPRADALAAVAPLIGCAIGEVDDSFCSETPASDRSSVDCVTDLVLFG